MLRSLKHFKGYKIHATDGAIGKVHDFFFDDEFWILRYVVVDTGRWLPGRKVLLTPGLLRDPDSGQRSFDVALNREQVRSSPDVDADQPVSRQHEVRLHEHYGWPFYWAPSGDLVGPITPIPMPEPSAPARPGDPHLRSVREIIGYDVEASDGAIGRVDDFIADTESWTIRYLVVGLRKWLPGRKVLISPQWLVGPISWDTRTVKIIMSRESIRNSPEYDADAPVNREYEGQLYDFYGRPHYWSLEPSNQNQPEP
ncbi:MAG TPA: PRC-barrel domain-containing protein [Verrucomicrobiae bacterium]|nr:PRC-barrel domain-containing protein [Verrucomicrobiae bacterium]